MRTAGPLIARRSMPLTDDILVPHKFIQILRSHAGSQRRSRLGFLHGMIKEIHISSFFRLYVLFYQTAVLHIFTFYATLTSGCISAIKIYS